MCSRERVDCPNLEFGCDKELLRSQVRINPKELLQLSVEIQIMSTKTINNIPNKFFCDVEQGFEF